MSWHSGKRNSSLQHRISDSDSSSEEDRPDPFLYNARFKAQYLSVSCNHSNCANKFSRSANHKGNLDLVEDQDDEAFSDSCTHSGFCSCSKQANSASINIRGCVTSVAEYATKSLIISKPNSLNNSQSVNVQPTNAQPIREVVNVPSNSDYVEEVNAHSNSDFAEEVNDASALPYSHRLEDPFIGSNINNCNLISSDKFNEAQVVSNSSRQRFSSHNEEKNTAQRTTGNNTDSSVENNAASQVEKIPLMDSQPTTSNCLSVSSGALLYNWQATMTTVKERFAFLFNNEVLSDVHFRVGKGELSQRIPAHKFVLAVGSAVFDAMFNGKLCSNQDEIEIPDVEPQAFLSLLRFLYSDDVHIGPETVMTVLYTAKKYAVPALERHCVEFLKCNLSSDNAFMLLTQARLFDEPQLAALCLDTIDKNTSDALLADGFTDIDHNTLCLVLERGTLRIRESKLFQAVVRWSVAQCQRENLSIDGNNQRTILEGALSLIRFPLMTIEEFAQGAAQSNILTDREVVQLFLHFTVNPKPTVNFLDTPRCCMTGKEQKVCRFPQIESRWGYSGTSDRIRFIVDRRIFIVGFGMYGSTHAPAEYEVTIQLIHTATGKVCASNDTSFVSDGSILTFRVMFKEPIEVLPNTNYTAYATLKGPDSHYGTKGVRKITVECPSGDRVTFQFTYAAGNNNGTSVEDGQIPEIIFCT